MLLLSGLDSLLEFVQNLPFLNVGVADFTSVGFFKMSEAYRMKFCICFISCTQSAAGCPIQDIIAFSLSPFFFMGFWCERKQDATLAEAATELIGFTGVSRFISEVVYTELWSRLPSVRVCCTQLKLGWALIVPTRGMLLQPVLLGLSQMIQLIKVVD